MNAKARELLGEEMSAVIYDAIESSERMDAGQRRTHTQDYTLMELRRSVLGRVVPPEGVRLSLRGYELIIENPSPVYIRFLCGNFWIGAHLLVVRCLEQAVDMICALLRDALPAALEAMKDLREPFGRAFVKSLRLKRINDTAEYINRQYGNQYQHEGASGYPGDNAGNA